MATEIWVNIGSGNGLLPEGINEPMLTYNKYGPVTLIWGQFNKRFLIHWPLKSAYKLLIWNLLWISHGQWVNEGKNKHLHSTEIMDVVTYQRGIHNKTVRRASSVDSTSYRVFISVPLLESITTSQWHVV